MSTQGLTPTGVRWLVQRAAAVLRVIGSEGGGPRLADLAPKVDLPKKDGKSETTLDGIPVTYEWKSDSAQEITIAGPDNPAWVGQWALVYVDTTGQHADAISKTNIHITTDIFPAVTIDDAKPWRRAGHQGRRVRPGRRQEQADRSELHRR